MLDKVRVATPEEVASIAEQADLTPTSTVFAFERPGGEPDLLVARIALELDPIFFQPQSGTARRAAFVWDAQNHFRKLGYTEYYFGVNVDDKEWIATIEKWGAERTTDYPEFRFKKTL